MTALARHTLRAAAAYESRPSAVLALLHRALREARDDGRFCTVAYCEFEVRPGGARMLLSCGGHPLPLVLRRSGAVEPVGKLGTLLGADVEPVLTDVTVELAPGELVVLYTDGVTEVRAGREEIFGHRDLAALLERCAGWRPTPSRSASRTRCSRRPRGARATTSPCSSSDRSRTPPIRGILPGAPRPPEAKDG